ncbi:hypothetical protein [Burkholderia cepacia]|uniref:Extensin n=1 Tax=Burkholderia cepacia GG4 TaxID=1009846 RepID=A0A9W3PBR5_BURCE|nr:hypothetical protein [Burkholderia cepacia]AFQ50921.1 hypothetical protein GEM_4531 [Burkholderia cepacia GG4]
MTSTRKTLMIVGGLLAAAAASGYVMLLRADHRAIAEAGIGDSAAPVVATATTPTTPTTAPAAPADDGHTAQGAIAPPAPAVALSAHVDDAVPQQAAVPPPAATPARTRAAPASDAVAPVIAGQALPAKPSPPPTVHVVTVEPEDAPPSKAQAAQPAQPVQSTPPVQAAPPVQPAQAARPSQQAAQPTQRAARKRDGLERHAAATPVTKSETPETAQLVRESAKLDPSLPPPQYVATPGADRQHTSAGANAVGAAMTDQLVRQSSSFKTPAPVNAGPTATQ